MRKSSIPLRPASAARALKKSRLCRIVPPSLQWTMGSKRKDTLRGSPAISTSGASPALAGLLAQVLRQLLPESLDGDVTALRRERHLLRATLGTSAQRGALLAQAVQFLENRPSESN